VSSRRERSQYGALEMENGERENKCFDIWNWGLRAGNLTLWEGATHCPGDLKSLEDSA
jgi:hypothetical protein